MLQAKYDNKGFTLIELLVVISIISLLASMLLLTFSKTLGKARDARRMHELRQIRSLMEIYYADYGYYPKESDGANGKVGEGAGLDSMLAPYGEVPHDPLGPGNPNYYYYYDGKQWCDGKWIAVLFVRRLEESSGNGGDFCSSWGGEGGAGQPEAWHIVLGPSDG